MKKLLPSALLAIGAGLFITGCASAPAARQIDTGGTQALVTTGLDMRNLMDAADRMIDQLLLDETISSFKDNNGKKPRISYSRDSIRDNTGERVQTDSLAARIQTALRRGGLVDVVAKGPAAKRGGDLDSFMNDDKVNTRGEEWADFYLEGWIDRKTVRQGGIVENNYTFKMSLNDRSQTEVWSDVVDITKQGASSGRRGGVGW